MASALMLCFDIWAFFVPAVIVVAVIILYIFWFFSGFACGPFSYLGHASVAKALTVRFHL